MLFVLALALGLQASAAGCRARRSQTRTAPTNATRVDGPAVPALPTDFTPPPPLDEPAPPEPGQLGLAYLEQLYPRIGQPWSAFLEDCRLRLPPAHALNQAGLETRVALTIDRKGELASTTLATRSGNADFDQAVLDVVREAAPFPAPPVDLISDDGVVHITWLFARDRRQAGLATAALERIEWPIARAVPSFLEAGDLTAAARRLERAATAGNPDDTLVALGRTVAEAAIREALRSEDAAVVQVALSAVAEARLAGLQSELRRIMETALDVVLRARAVSGLAAIGDRAAVPMLLSLFESTAAGSPGDTLTIIATAQALVTLGARAEVEARVLGWLDGDPAARLAALMILAEVPIPAAIPWLSARVTNPTVDRQIREAACTALGTALTPQNGATGIKAVRKGLDDADAGIRAACSRAVARAAAQGVRGRPLYWRAVELVKDRDEQVRAAAVLAAARLESRTFGNELFVLRRETSPQVLAALAQALATVEGAAVRGKLESLSRHPELVVQRPAVWTLAQRPEPEARKLAAGRVADQDEQVRLAAVAALAGLADQAALEALLADPEPRVARAAFAALVRLRGPARTLARAVQAIAEAPPASADRVLWARSWLSP